MLDHLTAHDAINQTRNALLTEVFGDSAVGKASAADLEIGQIVLVHEIARGKLNAFPTASKAGAFMRGNYWYRLYVVETIHRVGLVGLRPVVAFADSPLDQLTITTMPIRKMADSERRAYYPLGVTVEEFRSAVRDAPSFPAHAEACAALAKIRAAEAVERDAFTAAANAAREEARANAKAVGLALNWPHAVTLGLEGRYTPSAPLDVLEAALEGMQSRTAAADIDRAAQALVEIRAALR